MLTVSVTNLEKYRQFMNGTKKEKDLIDALSGKFSRTVEMKIGTAFHKMIEKPELTTTKLTKGRYWRISEGVAIPAEEESKASMYRKHHFSAIYEVSVQKIYTVAGKELKVKGRIDSMEGIMARYTKVRFNTIDDIEEYTDSCQWKFYCDMLNLKCLHYDVFQVEQYEKPKKPEKKDGDIIYVDKLKLKLQDPISCYAYPGMEAYLQQLMSGFIEWVSHRKLLAMINREITNEHDT